jgi:hypothetical protein
MKTCLKTTELPFPIALKISTSACSKVLEIRIQIFSNLPSCVEDRLGAAYHHKGYKFILNKDNIRAISRGWIDIP